MSFLAKNKSAPKHALSFFKKHNKSASKSHFIKGALLQPSEALKPQGLEL